MGAVATVTSPTAEAAGFFSRRLGVTGRPSPQDVAWGIPVGLELAAIVGIRHRLAWRIVFAIWRYSTTNRSYRSTRTRGLFVVEVLALVGDLATASRPLPPASPGGSDR